MNRGAASVSAGSASATKPGSPYQMDETQRFRHTHAASLGGRWGLAGPSAEVMLISRGWRDAR